ncbi:hypothetical protein BKA64DRAFT_746669 [Cadophora sp. MPI-SDFR-AT-0126]|nr:hypothetical protein BKA64DRAFT_746669 [Leotiomycetes sp. MPI-SDFR-AT-0126]
MAVNPTSLQQGPIPKPRYHPNPHISSSPSPFSNPPPSLNHVLLPSYLHSSLTHIITHCPPVLPWLSPFRQTQVYKGFFVGPTSIAYVFYSLSLSPTPYIQNLEISDRGLLEWSKAYLSLGQDTVLPLLEENSGIANEYLASNTLKACVFQSEEHARKVLSALSSKSLNTSTPASYCEYLKGRAGGLYMLRLIKRALPNLSTEIDGVMKELIEDILPQQPWTWAERQYLGTVHGEIGILTQIVLSAPSYATKLDGKLLELLALQEENGNWPVIPGKDIGLVQFCHGAPGFVISLLAIRKFFSGEEVQGRIEAAIEKGRECIWGKGVLVKEPNVCHGVLGNALAFEGDMRDAFLGIVGSPEDVWKGRTEGDDMIWEKDEDLYGCLWGEAGRAWIWGMEMERTEGGGNDGDGRCPLYTDV